MRIISGKTDRYFRTLAVFRDLLPSGDSRAIPLHEHDFIYLFINTYFLYTAIRVSDIFLFQSSAADNLAELTRILRSQPVDLQDSVLPSRQLF